MRRMRLVTKKNETNETTEQKGKYGRTRVLWKICGKHFLRTKKSFLVLGIKICFFFSKNYFQLFWAGLTIFVLLVFFSLREKKTSKTKIVRSSRLRRLQKAQKTWKNYLLKKKQTFSQNQGFFWFYRNAPHKLSKNPIILFLFPQFLRKFSCDKILNGSQKKLALLRNYVFM